MENLVFEVRSKFGARENRKGSWSSQSSRRSSSLKSIDLPLGGDSWPTGLYFAKIGLGTPSRDFFYVPIDTGSDLLWVNCAGCIRCPSKSDLMKLTQYDSDASSTARPVSCDDSFCSSYFSQTSKCDHSGTGSTNGTIIFGCGSIQTGGLEESVSAVDGIMGFGKSNSSFISQLASQGKVKRSFAHCLDNKNNGGGGGIFAIGEVVSPKVKKTTPMLPKSGHYSVSLTSVEVGDSVLQLSSGEVIVDSGTTLVYLPASVYMSLMNEILATHPELFYRVEDSFTCFHYTDKIYRLDRFPPVTFQFDKSASLTVYPRDYLLQFEGDKWCFGWQSSENIYGGILWILGDMALSNKLVVYDIENQVMGWTNHNCSGGIQVKDEESGANYTVGANNLSWSSSLVTVVSLLVHFLFTH
ncbi:Eukaryotic aspartyl protease family protein [Raphanus sativus]|uniref:Aspartic proteinase 39 isoform X2 n=1 Tax=Raphanus sativus TaxID=3726 RepID=A0A6J0JWV1_RAPSA|nr:aspartic proteinase 39 isoform X2 [Raphanus sativus]KAJ4886298.1 Eukaryotic aspartyl protease family protein [Raphanus sativus]